MRKKDNDAKKEAKKHVAHSPVKKRRGRIDSSPEPEIISDDDDFVAAKPAKKAKHHTNGSPKLAPKSPPKHISAVDFFGASKAKETTKPAHKPRKSPARGKDAELHEDSAFNAVLGSLDARGSEGGGETSASSRVVANSPYFPTDSETSKRSSPRKRVAETPEEVPRIQQGRKRASKTPDILIEEDPDSRAASVHIQNSPSPALPQKTPTPKKRKERSKSPAKTPKSDAHPKTPKTPKSEAEKAEQKKKYQSFLHRQGPTAIGSKELPQGPEDCLSGLKFLITGVLESMERETAVDLIKRHGGHVVGSLSKKTSFVVVGRDAGESKLRKIKELKLTTLDEDTLLELIRNKAGIAQAKAPQKAPEAKKTQSPAKTKPQKPRNKELDHPKAKKTDEPKSSKTSEHHECLSWVDKYKPKTVGDIVGQQGERSCVHKLQHWLRHWASWHGPGAKRKPQWNAQDGQDKRAALLSGPPGIGKTTSAHLVAKGLGLTVLEMNASDARKQSLLRDTIAPKCSNTSMDFFATEEGREKKGSCGIRQVLIMDEVDGMSGNEDRAGMSELIQMIKTTKFPIICICNDRQAQKIRSLVNHCFDLRFIKPRLETVRARLLSIAEKEGLKMSPAAADQLIEGANSDIRQVIQHLQLLAAGHRGETIDFDSAKTAAGSAKKDLAVNLFEAGKELLSGPVSGSDWIAKKTELFFLDYSMMPLFVAENYASLKPRQPGSRLDELRRLSAAADSIALGDRVDRLIRSTQNWSLLNTQCVTSAVIPVGLMDGYLGAMLGFPAWLGKNSNRNKRIRLSSQLQHHMSTRINATHSSLVKDYLPALADALSRPLVMEQDKGASKVRDVMCHYALTREDSDAVMELASWGNKDLMSGVLPKTKAALTRLLNAHDGSGLFLPYATEVKGAKRKKAAPNPDGEDEEEDEEEVDPDAFKKPAKKKKVEPAKGRGKKK